jgi:uncharacterized RDD family membrane protein YckC
MGELPGIDIPPLSPLEAERLTRLVALLYIWMVSLPAFEKSPFLIKILALAVPVFLLEPGLVAFTGGTPGHHLMGLRVRDVSRNQNIGLLRATARAIIRALFGWLSFVFMLVTRKHQALHDYFTSTVVVLRHPDALPAHEKFSERSEDHTSYVYPSKVRRVVVILVYSLLSLIAFGLLSFEFVSVGCRTYNRCGHGDNLLEQVLDTLWLVSVGAAIVLGWRGLLYGCRRSPLRQEIAHDS